MSRWLSSGVQQKYEGSYVDFQRILVGDVFSATLSRQTPTGHCWGVWLKTEINIVVGEFYRVTAFTDKLDFIFFRSIRTSKI